VNTSTAERVALIGLAVSTMGSLATAGVYWWGGNTQLEGTCIAIALGGVSVALIAWGNSVMPAQQVEGPRERLPSSDRELAALERDVHDPGITRRSALRRGVAIAAGAFGVAAVFPLRSLGPSPGRALFTTPWKKGLRLVTEDGSPVRADGVPDDGLVTVFPEGFPGAADGQAVLIRTAIGRQRPLPGREAWAPDGLVAYSKICTHAGCPVGLYQPEAHQLLCPCHQSTFDVLDGARPLAGPAAVALPQLPLRIDADGFVVADGDFSGPVGPGFWEAGP
jgi:ubiquinol-cytochrome c reductase iron-sulfur subunit